MSHDIPLEIERKYLIDRPDAAVLTAQPGCRVVEIEQIYLQKEAENRSERVRRWTCDGTVTYIYTCKEAVTTLTRVEREHEITAAEYDRLVADRADAGCAVIQKTRYRIPYQGQCVEIDLFPFWDDVAILEVELSGEEQAVALPPYVTVRREVTAERAYTNRALARARKAGKLPCE